MRLDYPQAPDVEDQMSHLDERYAIQEALHGVASKHYLIKPIVRLDRDELRRRVFGRHLLWPAAHHGWVDGIVRSTAGQGRRFAVPEHQLEGVGAMPGCEFVNISDDSGPEQRGFIGRSPRDR